MTTTLRGRTKAGMLPLLLAALAAVAGCMSAATSSPPSPAAAPPPSVTGGGVKALWQADPVTLQAFDGTTLLGAQEKKVVAVSAATGKVRWTTPLPASLGYVEALLPAAGTVVVEGLRDASQGPVAGFALSGYLGLDAASGKVAWTQAVSGTHAIPPAVVSGGYLVTGAPPGQLLSDSLPGPVTGRVAATGKVAWTLPQPKGCASLGLAADGPLLALSYVCGRQVLVERLDPATGKALWTWRSPPVTAKGAASMNLQVSAVSSGGGLVLLSGGVLGTGAAQRFAAALPNPRTWPSLLGPPLSGNMVLALTAAGHPAWTEEGGQQETLDPTGSAVCEEVRDGFECRADATGATSVPAQLTFPDGTGSGYRTDQYAAAAAGGLIAATEPVTGPNPGKAAGLRVIDAETGKTVATARLGGALAGLVAANSSVTAVAASPLTPSSALVLIRREGASGDPILPLLALSVPLPRRR